MVSKKKKILFKIVTILLVQFIMLLLLEIILRFLDPAFRAKIFGTKSNYISDDKLLIKPKDEYYFWDNKKALPVEGKIEHTFRIFALGDSFVKAHGDIGLENSFYRIVEKKLKLIREENKDYEVFHFGVSGYCEIQFLELIRRFGPKYKPDLILAQVYLGNDIAENSGIIKRYVDKKGKRQAIHNDVDILKIDGKNEKSQVTDVKNNNEGVNEKEQKVKKSLGSLIKGFLYNNFYSVRFFRKAIQELYWRIMGIKIQRTTTQPVTAIDLVNVALHKLNLMYIKDIQQIEDSWKVTEDLVSQIWDEAEKLNTRLLFILVPFEMQVNDKAWEKGVNQYHLDKALFDRNLPNTRFASILEKLNISYIDLTPFFREKFISGVELYFGHFNKTGHLVAGQEIYNKLIQEDMLTPK